jgi:hypothetical protein
MKAAVKLKKDKSPIVKIPIPNTKKPEPKKLLAKKEEPTIPKSKININQRSVWPVTQKPQLVLLQALNLPNNLIQV